LFIARWRFVLMARRGSLESRRDIFVRSTRQPAFLVA
jgi:hypothetical protein